MENYCHFNYVTSEGAVSHNVLYYQPLPITHHQEKLAIVSTAFNVTTSFQNNLKDQLLNKNSIFKLCMVCKNETNFITQN